jgi:hypothetical protein
MPCSIIPKLEVAMSEACHRSRYLDSLPFDCGDAAATIS